MLTFTFSRERTIYVCPRLSPPKTDLQSRGGECSNKRRSLRKADWQVAFSALMQTPRQENTPLYVGVAGLRIREVVREKPNSPPRSFELVDEKGSPPSSRTPWSIRGPQSGACVYKAGARGNRVGKRINFINLE